MIAFLKKCNQWLRNQLLDDVDKVYEGPLPYHKKFGAKKDPVSRINERFKEQKAQNRG